MCNIQSMDLSLGLLMISPRLSWTIQPCVGYVAVISQTSAVSLVAVDVVAPGALIGNQQCGVHY